MANICINQFAFYCEKDELRLLKLYTILRNFYETELKNEDGHGDFSIYNLLTKYLGMDSESAREISCRSEITETPELLEYPYKEGAKMIKVFIDSAWNPPVDFANELCQIVKEVMPVESDLDYVYMAEEPGCEIYINTDINREIFTCSFFMEWDDGKDVCSDYYEDSEVEIARLKSDIKSLTGLDYDPIDIIDDKEKMSEFQDAFYEKHKDAGGEDVWISIHYYEGDY